MKNLIFGVVVSFCLQAIHANEPYSCENQIAELRVAAVNFFSVFEPAHDISNGYVQDLQRIYGALNAGLSEYTSDDYGEGLSTDQLKSDMKEFYDFFFFLEPNSWNIIHSLEQNVFGLTETIRCFKIENNLKCQRRSSGNSCENELNKLQCDLSEFFERVVKGFNRAELDLDALLDSCTFFVKKTRNLYTNNLISCGPSCSISDTDSLRNIRNYIASFKSPRVVDAHGKLEHLISDTNTLVDDIKAWRSRLS